MKRFRWALLAMSPALLYGFFMGVRSVVGELMLPTDPALIEAARSGNIEAVRQRLNAGADVNARDMTRFRSCTESNPPRTLYTPLMLATLGARAPLGGGAVMLPSPKAGNLPMMKLLLERGADPNLSGSNDSRPLHIAASRGDVEAVKLLLLHGAKVDLHERGLRDQKNTGDTPLIEAAYRGHPEVVKLLLAHGADVNARGFLGFGALARCVSYRSSPQIAKLLISHGADVNAQDDLGRTPLHGAVDYGRVDAIRLLLKHGADPNILNNEGESPLAMVGSYGNKAMDRWQDGNDPLKRASRREQMIRLLRQAGTK